MVCKLQNSWRYVFMVELLSTKQVGDLVTCIRASTIVARLTKAVNNMGHHSKKALWGKWGEARSGSTCDMATSHNLTVNQICYDCRQNT